MEIMRRNQTRFDFICCLCIFVWYIRYSEAINMPGGRNLTQHVADDKHPRCRDIAMSPKKEFLFGAEAPMHHQASSENIFNTSTCPRGHPLPTSPVHPRALSVCPGSPMLRQDDLKSPTHPLPLPPGSPGSGSSRFVQSQWKKGKLLGRGTFGHVYLGFNRYMSQILVC